MKLISLYIENFGALSQYSLTFGDGLTVVQEPNGFGKTTLAEFIRAMFYGFPRKAKTLDKSKRQKYTPWNGGKFGGNLVFAHQGQRYRIERTFGTTPKGDSFTLIDLSTNKKSDRFSEQIGLELFQLDAESFERSTYMPQQRDLESLTTDSIQAKLGDLVEDTNDVGSYDKAVNALRTARSGLISYRGSGGTVAQAQSEVSRLQEELTRLAGLRHDLERAEQEIARMEEERESCRKNRNEIYERINRASEAASVAAAHERYAQLRDDEAECRKALEELRSRYPMGIPGEEALQEARQTAADAAVLASQTVTTREDQEAGRWLEENRSRFDGRIPTQEQLDACRKRITAYQKLRTEAETTGLSDGEKVQYEKLLPMAESGAFEPERLELLEKASRELTKKRLELENLRVPEEEARRLRELKDYFGSEVPSPEELQTRRQELEKIGELQADKGRLLAELAAEPEKKPSQIPLILPVLLAAAGICAGAALLMKGLTIWGGAALVIGAVCLICAVITGSRMAGRNLQKKERAQRIQAELRTVEEACAALEQKIAAFAQRYTKTIPLSDALHEIRGNREDLVELASKAARTENQRQQLGKKISALEAALTRELGTEDYDRGIRQLYLAKGQLQDLQEELQAAEEKIRSLESEWETHRSEISGFLSTYFESVEPTQFHSLLSDLERDREAYLRAREQTERWQERKQKHEEDTRRCEERLAAFFGKWGLTKEPNVWEQLMHIRDDRKEFDDLALRLEEASRKRAAYESENQEKLAIAVPEPREDPAALRAQEQQITERIEELAGQILDRRQRHRELGNALSRVPGLRDELEQWQEKKAGDQKKAKLLDDTMEFLEKAREKLQSSYLGPVREAFSGYMEHLLGEKAERILLTPDLDVQLERNGQARELGYFSAGQTDTVMLCMRMALVDALFTGVKPFVILDDPFVNLDDDHTAEALKLLQKLAEDRQILYLVCNSSRNLE